MQSLITGLPVSSRSTWWPGWAMSPDGWLVAPNGFAVSPGDIRAYEFARLNGLFSEFGRTARDCRADDRNGAAHERPRVVDMVPGIG